MSMLLRPAPLLTLAVLALAISASLYTAPFGLFLLVILLSWTFKYSIALLDGLVTGKEWMPVLSVEMVLGSLRQWRLMIALGLTILFFFVASTSMEFYSRVLLVPIAAAVPIVLPAALTVQAWTQDTAQALRPSLGLGVAQRLGADYLRLAALTALLIVLVAFAATRVPVLPLRVAVYLLCWFAVVVQVGRTVRAKRALLEAATMFEPPLDFTESAAALAAARERAADEIYAHWRNGATVEAWNAVERHVRAARHPAGELLWLQRRVSLWNAKPLEKRIAEALEARGDDART